MKYIDAEKLIAEIERRRADAKLYDMSGGDAPIYDELLSIITSLQQEQPDNEDIDKVAQELYEHLYELKRRNNVPTNLYDKQEIIDLWKAGIEYGRNHPKQEQPEVDLEKFIENEMNHYGLSLYSASYETFSASQIDRIIRNAFELGLNARKEE